MHKNERGMRVDVTRNIVFLFSYLIVLYVCDSGNGTMEILSKKHAFDGVPVNWETEKTKRNEKKRKEKKNEKKTRRKVTKRNAKKTKRKKTKTK